MCYNFFIKILNFPGGVWWVGIFLEFFLKMSWRRFSETSRRRLENLLKTSWRRVTKTNILVLTKTSWRRLEDAWLRRICSSWSRCLEDVFWRQRQKTSSMRLQDVFIKMNVCWEVVTGKTPFFVVGSFCSHHSVCLNIGFWQSIFAWKWCAFNLSGLNLKTVLQFFGKALRFPEICFKVKVLKTFKTSSDCHIKTCISLKRRAISKIPNMVF